MDFESESVIPKSPNELPYDDSFSVASSVDLDLLPRPSSVDLDLLPRPSSVEPDLLPRPSSTKPNKLRIHPRYYVNDDLTVFSVNDEVKHYLRLSSLLIQRVY